MTADQDTAARERRACDLVEQALDRPPANRRAWLEGACGSDASLLERALALLEAAPGTNDTDGTWQLPEPERPGNRWLNLAPGDALGPYRIVAELGRGGMGVVYHARRGDAAFDLDVAIKSIARLGSDDLTRRFESERRILARLQHPHIARVLDGGTTSDDLPYLVMEYIEGEPLDLYCDRHRLSIEERLELFLQVCDGLDHAHRSLVVHRDLKPGNILVTKDGQVKLLDFGIARFVDEDGRAEISTSTRWGGRAMTPEYASPEQLELEPITTQSDVYSLGVLLYELLTGRRPHDLHTKGLAAGLEAIRRIDPEPPSVRLLSAADDDPAISSRCTTRSKLVRRLRGDLDNITMLALRKEPRWRYRSVDALAGDIRRHLAGEPVSARKPTLPYVLGRYLRRHAIPVTAVTLALLALGIGGAIAIAQGLRATREAERTQRMNDFLEALLTRADPVRGLDRDATLAELVDYATERLETDFADDPGIRGSLRRTLAATHLNLGDPERARPLFEQALREHLDAYGPGHPETTETERQFAVWEDSTGEHAAALERLERVLAELESRHEPTLELALAYDQLGSVLNSLGRGDEALEAFEKGIAILDGLGTWPYEQILLLNNMSVAQLGDNDPTGAVTTLGRALDLAAAHWEKPFPLQARIHANLGLAHRELGDLEAAELHLTRAVQLLTELLGAEHPETLLSRIALAAAQLSRGRPEPAHHELVGVQAAAAGALAEGHPIVQYANTVHAEALVALGRGADAEARARAALDSRRESLPEGHWLIASSQTTLASALLLQNRRTEAIGELEEALPILEATRGEEFGKTREARDLLSRARDLGAGDPRGGG